MSKGQPSYKELQCPKCKQYNTFRAIYVRSEGKNLRIGRMCVDVEYKDSSRYVRDLKGCGYKELEENKPVRTWW